MTDQVQSLCGCGHLGGSDPWVILQYAARSELRGKDRRSFESEGTRGVRHVKDQQGVLWSGGSTRGIIIRFGPGYGRNSTRPNQRSKPMQSWCIMLFFQYISSRSASRITSHLQSRYMPYFHQTLDRKSHPAALIPVPFRKLQRATLHHRFATRM